MAQDDISDDQSRIVSDQEPEYKFGAVDIGIIVASCVILVSFFVGRFYIRRLQHRRQLDMEFQARQRDLEALYEENGKQRVTSMASYIGSAEPSILKGDITIQSKINNLSEKQVLKPPLWRYINSKHPRNGSVTLAISLHNRDN
ncbi:hypothetical protein NEUTE1DRAFT_149438 [Neurospora tetrasperma FGSC 2508]|uniref:Uncharacterized protein n=1 Tax=Neurospora tetrasperma (strain FGSC 2508 / ATCC MYA-4615 / P0657) TaxID=510951 RepID=F8N3B4_NEUT8|nr:uncharacterized protein NEUTE1DRAFT_149438 [Neurospora tetrasperma FGSC 2508]EGO51721.1 hypothetical protein NEUTE1DRAFT_149438 [Neurospora tetrasperma FGSC 2508]EGZ78279.1 hypothetical protein NEUTE2DRAFT_154715 [Neurospora tetrasperma FGSC 2509]